MKIITNPTHINSYKRLVQVQDATHEYLRKRKYLPVDLPVLAPALIPESYLEVFKTEFTYGKHKESLYLTPSPELFLKRLLAYGIGSCYYLGKAFRNSDPNAQLHSPEFTMLEFYRVKADYMDIADEVLKLLRHIAEKMGKGSRITYRGETTSLEKWEQMSVAEAFNRYAGITPGELFNHKRFISKAGHKGYVTGGFSYEDVFSQIYVQEVEPYLGRNGFPTLLTDYPLEFAALAKLNKDNRTAQRFEFYISGVEIGDCYTELVDPDEQNTRFEKEQLSRKLLNRTEHPIDKGFVEALQYGLVDCAGIAIGFDRLAMVFADASSINDLKLISIV